VSGQQEQMKIPLEAYERYSGSLFSCEINLARRHLIDAPFNRSGSLGSDQALEIHDGQRRSTVGGDPQMRSIAPTSDCRAQRFVLAPYLVEDVLC
jgi:hypothetical protein